MSTGVRVSNFAPIQLHHDYSNVVHTEDQACFSCAGPETFPSGGVSVCSDLVYPMLEAFVSQGNVLTQDIIFSRVRQLCGDATDEELEATFRSALRRGIIQVIVPPVVNYLVAPPTPTYTLSARMDEKASHRKYVLFLLHQIGGLQSPDFVRWFLPYRFAATKFDMMGQCTVNAFG